MMIKKQQPAFVILFAALTTVLMLVIGAGIFSISTKQALLSGDAREAQYAFTAADTGMECALMAELSGSYLTGGVVSCAGQANIPVDPLNQNGAFRFSVEIPPETTGTSPTCAVITVTTIPPMRNIISQGYNLCQGSAPVIGNPRLVERVLESSYQLGGGPSQNLVPGGGNTIQSIQGGNGNQQQGMQQIPFSLQGQSDIDQYIALLTQNSRAPGNVPEDADFQKILDVQAQTIAADTTCPAGYIRQSASVSVSTSSLISTSGQTVTPTGDTQKPSDGSASVGTSSTPRLSTGTKVNTVNDPCVPVNDCPAGYVRQSATVSTQMLTNVSQYTDEQKQAMIDAGTWDDASTRATVSTQTIQGGNTTKNPCVQDPKSGTASARLSSTDVMDAGEEKTVVGGVIQSVVDVVQQSVGSVLEFFK
jgi:hypothetical protein